MDTQASINLIREIINDDDGLERHGVWLSRCLADYIGPAGEGKTLENCFQIPKNWRNKERLQKRNQAIHDLIRILPVEGYTKKAIQLKELIDDYLNGNWRHDYVYGLPTDADEQCKLLFDIVKNGGALCQRRIEQIINEI